MKRVLAALALAAVAVAAPGAAQAQDTPVVTLLHGIPGQPVDVSVGGQVLLSGFEPGATQDLSAFAGQTLTDLQVLAAGTDTVLLAADSLALPDSGNSTVVAFLDATGNPTLQIFENNVDPVPDGQARVIVRHTAAAPAVDLVVGEDRPIENAANGDEGELLVPAGELRGLRVAPTGGDPLLDVPPLSVDAGTDLIVYAVGSFDDATLTFYQQEIEVGTTAPTSEAGSDSGDAGDDTATATPTSIETGRPFDVLDPAWAYALGLAALAFAGGAFAMRRREHADRRG